MIRKNKQKLDQEQKSEILVSKPKKAQEEMLGFALIVVILAVIMLIFLGFSLNKENKEIDSYEIESFVTVLSHYTSTCQDNRGNFLEIKDLIANCDKEESCLSGEKSCKVLNSTITGILDTSWKITENSPVKGYYFGILVNNRSLDSFDKIERGNQTSDSRGAQISLPRTKIFMTVYY
ncbi:MAG: hypothetical protein AABW50_00795 [Nanoarchaeota archaeon]